MKMGIIVRRTLKSMVFVALTSISSQSLAELRVIIEYDNIEHRLMKLVELPSSNDVPLSDHRTVNTEVTSVNRVNLKWFDADGVLVATGSIVDPRVTHAPLTLADQAPTVVGLAKGAYIVSGPLASTLLEIHLPASSSLGLDVQIWRIALDR